MLSNNTKFYNTKNFFIIIFISFFLSNMLNYWYMKNYDRYEISSDSNDNHYLIKGDSYTFWKTANILKEQFSQGKSYFETGTEYRVSYLPSRINLFFSNLFNFEIFDTKENIKIGKRKFSILYFQTFFYYLSLLFLYKNLKRFSSIKVSFLTCSFLAIEPSIFQYHSSFWSESIFISLLIFCISLIFKENKNIYYWFCVGLVFGILYLQRSVTIYYFLIIFLWIFLLFKRKSLKKIIVFALGIIIFFGFLGFHNYKRIGIGYVIATQVNTGFYNYLTPHILAASKKIEIEKAEKIIESKLNKWKNDNGIYLNGKNWILTEENILSKNELLRLKIYSYKKNFAKNLILSNPIITAKYVIKKSFHFLIFNPTQVFYEHSYEYKARPEKVYYKNKDHYRWIPARISYSFLIYLVSLLGFIHMILNGNPKELKIVIFLSFSILYFTAVSSWSGNPRYAVPTLIFYSIFFSNGVIFLINKFKSKS